MGEFASFLQNNLADFWTYTGFHNATLQHALGLHGKAAENPR